MQMNDMVIASVDDHIIEPPTMFDQHLSAEHRKYAPRYVTGADGHAFWSWDHEDMRTYNIGLNAVVGRPKEEYGTEPMNIDQMRKGTWDSGARIDDMNASGMLTSVNFPTFCSFDGSWFWRAKDKDNAARVIAAYNDWHIDEWCAPHRGRYIPTAILPLWDVQTAIRELQRVIRKGCRSISFPSNPLNQGAPASIHDEMWEPLWALCDDEQVVLNCHIGTGQPAAFASGASPISAWITSLPMAIGTDAADLLHLTALLRYPNLKFSLSEGGIGWIPYMLERADFVYRHHGAWVRCQWGGKLPSEVFREHFLCCFIEDRFGCANYQAVGEDLIAYECDYPHSDCTWPSVAEELWENVKGLPTGVIDKITHGNVFSFFGVDPVAELGGRDNCTVSALRAKALNVDVSERSLPGKDARIIGQADRAVTCADVQVTLAERK
ncbi:amidohydrolase family protein [Sphingobium sp. Sx8-8]|uniref:amidohydrolase family protein n=1 Tax=Sphingobium sp. Sx8-8 TaxID=2933617 RepID=UPI001F590F2C|nr:amidohydrolase family protein [Sphingobium sp. Sx8-8]